MNTIFQGLAFSAAFGVALTGSASAAEVLVTSNITTSTTWTADNTYNLQGQIYVMPGASLTIDAGVRVASDLGGSLAVANGAQIFVNGTQTSPVVMTSKLDTGVWREAANEWGNLTIMGDGYISEDATPGNVPTPSASNFAFMEGLVGTGTENTYGGGNDDDDSGSINYLSLRYGGKVVSLANELNGLSLGGVGRGTDIDYVEVMNNVDDGIEIWGGTVNLKHFSIWNVGDDSFDVDQGWRGKAQFGLIVQGYSLDASQGSGVGDNCFETDGAEDSDWQPVTTAAIYNATVIGQPIDGDGATAWRDNARVQYHQSIFMDCGEKVVRADGDDGDGAQGYGHNGTLSFADTWTTDHTAFSLVNAPATPADFYKSQTSGKLAQIVDSVFFRNLSSSAYTEADARGVFDAGNNNVLTPGFDDADAPIKGLVRSAPVTRGGKQMVPVVSLDPRAANAALVASGTAPSDGFFTPVGYRGAFDPQFNWLCGWSASDEFGFIDVPATATVRTGANNVPSSLTASGAPTLGNAGFAFVADNPTASCGVTAGSLALVFVTLDGPFTLPLGSFGCDGGFGTLLIAPSVFKTLSGLYLGTPASIPAPLPADASLCGLPVSAQVAFATPTGAIRLGDAVDLVLGN
ncbi:MAG: hypothetical protein P1V81_09250 [Planctomycetota bacterium]|nr:hypothetical protein [Planctomycetota bacterium]